MTISPRIHRVHWWNSVHVDPLSVLDILDVHITNSYFLPHLLYVPPSSSLSLTRPSFLFPSPYPTPYSSLTHQASYPTCCCRCRCCSLQNEGNSPLYGAVFSVGDDETVLGGHTETVQALLQAPDINVNQANVSIYLLTPSPVVVWGVGWGSFATSTSTSFSLLWCPITP